MPAPLTGWLVHTACQLQVGRTLITYSASDLASGLGLELISNAAEAVASLAVKGAMADVTNGPLIVFVA